VKKLIPVIALLAGCAGDGNQMCGADHCGLQGHTVVKWQFDHYPEWSFPFDSCVDFGVNKVHVDAVGDDGSMVSTEDDCGTGQVTFDGLLAQNYTMYVAPRDFGGADLISFPSSGTVQGGQYAADTTVTVNVPWTAWLGSYTGTFLWRLSWGGVTCADAMPMPVVTQVLTLMVNGNAVTSLTDSGHRLDGTDPEPCRGLDDNFPQSATTVPFGPATLIVEGRDVTNHMMFHHEFDTFVGAGVTNPTITYDVPMGGM
jgi:hypothetical protein